MTIKQCLFDASSQSFADELRTLCRKYGVSNIVLLTEFEKQYTAVIQYADTKQGEPHETFTSIKLQLQEQLNALLITMQKEN